MCKPKQSNGNIVYKIPLIESIITGYINSIDSAYDLKDIFTVNLTLQNDTLRLHLSDTYPLIPGPRYNCEKIINGSRVVFTGEIIDGCCILNKRSDIPADIIKANKDRWPLYRDFRYWLFRFKDEKLIDYEPKNEIDQFVKMGQ